ncbi:hypothetical protein vB_PsyM_KIL3b_0094 [Pseudomonas phage vB_PsyM_KIL3b]|uniref:Uncharacterized protein n=4 Tax=Pseudomonas phage vB_PsyM_KIL1 TaxID=1777065 RepID=A0A142IE44_9CAUD|nr:hypothetical protein BH774_gp109 [Pseudomonas phage vB_PsyM_KIL1]AMR57340.1 hypothetical protein vB_PsyM_KIL1_0093 [Pseudomonas phage vB_PsyM_KIL1]AMR57499.1 hypothetical protein vB_PsyM_KIL2_0099 [Pseudomonas phage vB_PsyM_KIL2]AMR57661.1 hypothetical protein vB_PsyM_KIL3_0094 [Pseudomonas phage vB_PsyM_KIL3]AMR58159.1 hypothetical protein vB_PsyM_KIL3b_0094 [Pseudomonas phage vB_PsyM_KIL3b]
MEHKFEWSPPALNIDPWARTDFLVAEPKVVAFDYDETISDSESTWLAVMLLLEKQGYHCIVCTWRTPTTYPEDLQFLVDRGFKVYYTSGQAKRTYMEKQGVKVAIWIDTTLSLF